MESSGNNRFPLLRVALLLISLVLLFLLFQKSLLFVYVGFFSILIWVWLVLFILFLVLSFFRSVSLRFGLSFVIKSIWFVGLYLLLSLFLILNIFWSILPFGTDNTQPSGNSSSDGLSLDANLVDYPKSSGEISNPQIRVQVKNTSRSDSLRFEDIQNNKYAFEFWQESKDGKLWMLEMQGYSYFRDLPEVRELMVEDFGVINPGEKKELVFTLQNLNVLDAAPTAPSVEVGRDSSGTFYSKYPNHLSFSCGSGVFRLEFGEVVDLHSNVRGIMIADLQNLSYSNEVDIVLSQNCGN